MARKKGTRSADDEQAAALADWRKLTWDDLARSFESRTVARGETYARENRVSELSVASDGRLLATVDGTESYACSVGLIADKRRTAKVSSICTCPVGVDCKHAVATIVALLDALTERRAIAPADPDDERWDLIEDAANETEAGDEADDKEFGTPRSSSRARSKSGAGSVRPPRKKSDDEIRKHLQAKTHAELVEWAAGACARFPALRRELAETIAFAGGDVTRLLAEARRELRAVTSETGWRSWTEGTSTPDYSRLKRCLQRLIQRGRADDVVALGRELLTLGLEQVERSNDEGDTMIALGDCISVVFAALPQTSMPDVERILYVVEMALEDDYEVVAAAAHDALQAACSTDAWSLAADRLAKKRQESHNRSEEGYRGDRNVAFLALALKNANRRDELRALYEAEAPKTKSYYRLVSFLLELNDVEAAERWAREGIVTTYEKLPGIAAQLLGLMCELARRRKNWNLVAAHAAMKYFEQPGIETLKELLAAARKAGCRDAVQTAAMAFLELGTMPYRLAKSAKGRTSLSVEASWPLGVPDYAEAMLVTVVSRSDRRPRHDVLLDLALAEKRVNDVLNQYDKLSAERGDRSLSVYRRSEYAEAVAQAVAKSHPERALDIYRRKLDALLPRTGESAYESAVECLRKMKAIYKAQDRDDYFDELVADVREKYRNRPRFIECLDKLAGRTILQTQRKPGRR